MSFTSKSVHGPPRNTCYWAGTIYSCIICELLIIYKLAGHMQKIRPTGCKIALRFHVYQMFSAQPHISHAQNNVRQNCRGSPALS